MFTRHTLVVFILLLLFSHAAVSASKTKISASANSTYLKHENYDANGFTTNTESGFLPGVQVSIANSNNHFKSTFSAEAYNGSVGFKKISSNGIFSSTVSERLARLSYRLDYHRPRQFYQYYAMISLNDWARNIEGQTATNSQDSINGINRNYRWFNAEAGLRLSLYKGRYNFLRTDLGLSYNFLNELLIDLTQNNMGKPLLNLGSRLGGSANIIYTHFFNRKHGGEMFLKTRYWQFGSSNKRTITNSAETIDVKEEESQSLTSSIGVTYFYRF